jgi:hypothetical protein
MTNENLSVRDNAKKEALQRLKDRKSIWETLSDEQKEFIKNWDGPVEIGIDNYDKK